MQWRQFPQVRQAGESVGRIAGRESYLIGVDGTHGAHADASLAAIRASAASWRIAFAAMTRMIATTIRSSVNE